MLCLSQRAAALLLVLALGCSGPAAGQQSAVQGSARPDPRGAQRLLEDGKRAEAAGRFEEALAAYDAAARRDPRETTALERGALLRSRLVHRHVDDAERLALAGSADQATAELRAALRLDPGNSNVAERLAQIAAMAAPPQAQPAGPGEPRFAGAARLQPRAGNRSFDLRGDTQNAYQQIAQAFGLKALFDPELPSRTVRLRLSDVDFPTVAGIVAAQTGTFLRPMAADTFFVTADTPAKRREYDQQIEQTFLLPASASPEEMTEMQRMLREIAGATRSQVDTAGRTITIRDTPRVVALAGELIRELEQARGELLLEIELLEVNRSEALKLGITPPSSTRVFALSPSDITALEQAPDLATLIGILQRIFGAQGALGGSASQIASLVSAGQLGASALLPPLIAFGGGQSTLLTTLPGAAAQFSQALSLVRSGRRILLRAQDGKPASFFVGDRFPVTLALLSSSLGTPSFTPALGANILPRSDFNTGNDPLALVAADFNADGLRDLAVANHNDSSVTILLNRGSGNFSAASGSPIVLGANQTGASAIASGDFNGDSLPDLVVANQSSNNVTVLLGKGDGTFTPAAASPIAAGNGPSAIVTGDFNGDGKRDFAVSNFSDNTVSVFLGNGLGGFSAAPGSPFLLPGGEQGPVALGTADFNGDGKADLAVVNRTSNNVSILLGNGDGTFHAASGSPIAVGATPVALAAGDLNGDTRPDLAIVNQADNSVTVLLNNGDGTFQAATNSPLATGAAPSGVAIADFNSDGTGDLLVTNAGLNTISVHLGLGAGLFAPRFALPTAAGPSAVVAADFNNDARPDAAFSEATANQVSIIFDPVSFGGGAGGAVQQPYPASEYVDLGVKVKATPALHPNGEVTLQMEFEIRSRSGQSVNGIPILSNRTISQTIRVRDDEATLIGGLLDKEETRALSGLPGFANVPGAGYLAGAREKRPSETEMLILVTPHRLRLPHKISRTIYAGRGGGVSGAAPEPPVDQ
ncbi:MAG: FG-GAP-like repeat-containing protein [Acidobacteriia bacterium]|nr:FG-GAP-like repeat-containing protein [Terriglobia bacterium]